MFSVLAAWGEYWNSKHTTTNTSFVRRSNDDRVYLHASLIHPLDTRHATCKPSARQSHSEMGISEFYSVMRRRAEMDLYTGCCPECGCGLTICCSSGDAISSGQLQQSQEQTSAVTCWCCLSKCLPIHPVIGWFRDSSRSFPTQLFTTLCYARISYVSANMTWPFILWFYNQKRALRNRANQQTLVSVSVANIPARFRKSGIL